jgi:hypothetical protein
MFEKVKTARNSGAFQRRGRRVSRSCRDGRRTLIPDSPFVLSPRIVRRETSVFRRPMQGQVRARRLAGAANRPAPHPSPLPLKRGEGSPRPNLLPVSGKKGRRRPPSVPSPRLRGEVRVRAWAIGRLQRQGGGRASSPRSAARRPAPSRRLSGAAPQFVVDGAGQEERSAAFDELHVFRVAQQFTGV